MAELCVCDCVIITNKSPLLLDGMQGLLGIKSRCLNYDSVAITEATNNTTNTASCMAKLGSDSMPSLQQNK